MTDTTASDTPGNAATTTTGAETTTTTTTGTEGQPWYSGFEDPVLRGKVELKGWKDPKAAIESYFALESHVGVPPDRLIKLPEKADDPGWVDIKKRLGMSAPDKPEDYGLTAAEGGDPEFAKTMAGVFHKAGLTKDQSAILQADWNKTITDIDARQAAANKVKGEAELATLRNEWGGAYDASVEAARRAATEVGPLAGMTAEDLSALEGAVGTAKFLKMFAAVGSKNNTEADFHGAADAGGAKGFMSPDVARARIETLKADPVFGAAWLKEIENGVKGPKQQELEQLHKIASGGQ